MKVISVVKVSTWEFFTPKDIFRSEPNQNVRPLEGKDRDDVLEVRRVHWFLGISSLNDFIQVVAAARQHVETEEPELEFLQVRNGYRYETLGTCEEVGLVD